MDRLTKTGAMKSAWFLREGEPTGIPLMSHIEFQIVLDRLAAYEDTGLTPEELMSLKTDEVIPAHWQDMFIAECENRLLILPCRVGDTVYVITYNNEIAKGVITGFSFGEKLMADIIYEHHGKYAATRYWGETAFLSHEEAEAALRRIDNG